MIDPATFALVQVVEDRPLPLGPLDGHLEQALYNHARLAVAHTPGVRSGWQPGQHGHLMTVDGS
jgi:hypothetical protein